MTSHRMVFTGLKLPRPILDAARQQAEADHRPLASYLRLLITEAVEREAAVHARGAQHETAAGR